ncbi:hypothetical protein ACTXT7_001561 [Hymenolepis weldensis]
MGEHVTLGGGKETKTKGIRKEPCSEEYQTKRINSLTRDRTAVLEKNPSYGAMRVNRTGGQICPESKENLASFGVCKFDIRESELTNITR